MVKHRVRPGITGWAQVHGWRGDTSIAERIKFDIDYIENWSWSLDARIFARTLTKGFVDDNAY
jgi:lipopolysaccharide/colanic/teichoic acid biosynthesis glycosyltransferase